MRGFQNLCCLFLEVEELIRVVVTKDLKQRVTLYMLQRGNGTIL
jgi:hypothetical protein